MRGNDKVRRSSKGVPADELVGMSFKRLHALASKFGALSFPNLHLPVHTIDSGPQ